MNFSREELCACRKSLMGFAISLTRNYDTAEDLVQETMYLALRHQHQFTPGTNLQAWLFTILRNRSRTNARKWMRNVEDPDNIQAEQLPAVDDLEAQLIARETLQSMACLPAGMQTLLLMAGDGASYQEMIAATQAASAGTVKSRLHRARASFREIAA